MSDRHLRRLGQDYGTAFLTLLPQGQAWPRYPGTTLDLACRGLAEYWGYVDSRAADLLERESDPRITLELLPDWERNWGLPDPCYKAPQNISERQLALVMRMTMEGAQSREFFIGVAAMIGYAVTITEYRTFVCGIDRCGDNRVYGDGSVPMYNEWWIPILNLRGNPVAQGELSEWPYYGLGPETNRFYWTVHVDNAKLVWFRCSSSQCGVDPHLRIGTADDLECLLNRWKPAHSQIIFDYSGLQDPAKIVLSASTVAEDAPIGTIIGTFDIQNAYTGTPQYSLLDDAGGRFSLIGNQLKVAAALSYATAASHLILVAANDITPIPGNSPFTITVTDVAPVITSPSAANNVENTVLAKSLTANKTVTWAIVGGADAARFELSASTLRWTGNGTKNFEAPNDANADNAYVVQISATDSASLVTNQTITVTVTNVAEPATFNPADTGGSITLSNGNLTVTATAGGATGVRTTIPQAAGKFYFEVKWTTPTGGAGADGVGIASAAASLTVGLPSNGALGCMVYVTGSVFYNTAVQSAAALGAFANNDVCCVAVDMVNKRFWARKNGGNWNNSGTANPATNVGGIDISSVFGSTAAFSAVTKNGTAPVAIGNFGQSSFAFTIPSGFSAGPAA